MKNVLVIGATSAIAAEVARLHAERGDRLVLMGRDAKKLATLQAELSDRVAAVVSADFDELVANEARVQEAIRVLETTGGLDVALIAHGSLGDQLESERSFAHAEAVLRTNFTSVVSFVVPLANHFEARGKGALVVLSSVAGDRGRPRNYTYGAAKGAISTYLQGVRSRLFASTPRVRVVNVRLGPVDTPMTKDHPKNALFGEVRDVAVRIVRAEDHGPQDVYLPWYWAPIMAVVRNLPERIFQRFAFLAGR
jgi:short-subunit dehydrogenase